MGTRIYNTMGQRTQKAATPPIPMTQRHDYDEQGHLTGEYASGNSRDTIGLGETDSKPRGSAS